MENNKEVKDSDYDSLKDKTITFTGYFSEINIDDILLLNGEFTKHNKYGDQFLASSYEVVLPEEKDGIVTFLSSDMFKGIGETKAKKIYDTLGVSFDSLNGEAFYSDKMQEVEDILKNKGILYESQGAMVVDVAEESDSKEKYKYY